VPFLWVTGEAGVGKRELIRRVHEGCSERGYILGLDCESADQQQIEAELFGHQAEDTQKGTSEGKLADAEAGILTISEPQRLTEGCQQRLLEWQRGRRLRRSVSDGRYEDPDPLIIFVAREHPEELVRRGAVLPGLVTTALANIHIPALRERPEDVVVLSEHLLRVKVLELTGWEFSIERNFQDEALFILVNFHWPDNTLALQEVVALLAGAILFNSPEHRITVAEVIEALETRYRETNIRDLLTPLFRAQSQKWSRTPKDDVWLDELRVLRCLSDMGYDLRHLAKLVGTSPSTLSRKFSNAGLGGLPRGRHPKNLLSQ
jgi:DNA-binding NtrC family response regulator